MTTVIHAQKKIYDKAPDTQGKEWKSQQIKQKVCICEKDSEKETIN